MNIQKIKATQLNPASYNPRKDLKSGDKEYDKLRRSIEEFGYVEPVIWNQQTGNVVGGHQRLKVLLDLGREEVDCVVVDLDIQKEKALNIALNKIQGDWDEAKLSELMAGLDESAFDVSLTGFDAGEVDALLDQFYSKEAIEDAFDVENAKAEIKEKGAVTQPGDIWMLGNHRLLCGSAASEEDCQRLMDGTHAQMAFTAPPSTIEPGKDKSMIDTWLETMRPAVQNICRHADIICWQMLDVYAPGTQFIEPTGFYSVQLFAEEGHRPIWIRIWKKQGYAVSTGRQGKPAQQFEYVTAFAGTETDEYNDQEYVWVSAFAGHSYRFVKRLTPDERKKWGYAGIWEIAAAPGKTSCPVELPWRCLKLHSDSGSVAFDPFSCAGTTIIAAEQTSRRCYAMEASPVYCDLAVKRWEEFTGETATRLEIES